MIFFPGWRFLSTSLLLACSCNSRWPVTHRAVAAFQSINPALRKHEKRAIHRRITSSEWTRGPESAQVQTWGFDSRSFRLAVNGGTSKHKHLKINLTSNYITLFPSNMQNLSWGLLIYCLCFIAIMWCNQTPSDHVFNDNTYYELSVLEEPSTVQ